MVIVERLVDYLNNFLVIGAWSSLIIVYENSTAPMVTALLPTLHHKYALVNVDQQYRYPAAEPGRPYQIFFTDDEDFQRHDRETVLKDPVALLVQCFDEHNLSSKIIFSRQRFPLSERCPTLIIPAASPIDTGDLTVMLSTCIDCYCNEIMPSIRQLKLVNVVVMIWWTQPNKTLLIRLRYESQENCKPTDNNIANYDKAYDLTDDHRIAIRILFEAPRIINMSMANTLAVGGRDAFFGSILGNVLAVDSLFFAQDPSELRASITDKNSVRYFQEFFDRSYVEVAAGHNEQRPQAVPFIVTTTNHADDGGASSLLMINRSIIQLESQIHVTHGDIPLYPNEYELFVLVVPNIYHDRTATNGQFSPLQLVRRQPLISIWVAAILLFSIVRKWLRSTLKTPPTAYEELLINTFGMSFGSTGPNPRRGSRGDRNGADRMLSLFVSVFAMLAAILCSGVLFQQFTAASTASSIRTLEDLGQHLELEIWMLEDLHASTEQWLRSQ